MYSHLSMLCNLQQTCVAVGSKDLKLKTFRMFHKTNFFFKELHSFELLGPILYIGGSLYLKACFR